MKFILTVTAILFFTFSAKSQITKGNWMVGGNASVRFVNEDLNSTTVDGRFITLSPTLGYFIQNKLAAGARLKFNSNKLEYNGGTSKLIQYGIGPFFRYYFLSKENNINVLAEAGYQFVNSKGSGPWATENTLLFSAGPVLYFNSSVGLEFLINYESYNNKGANVRHKTFSFGIGFQIHLEKEINQ